MCMYEAKHRSTELSPLPSSEKEKSWHGLHCAWLVAPVAARYLPAEHSVHGAVPLEFLYEPTSQAAQPDVETPVQPMSHRHSSTCAKVCVQRWRAASEDDERLGRCIDVCTQSCACVHVPVCACVCVCVCLSKRVTLSYLCCLLL